MVINKNNTGRDCPMNYQKKTKELDTQELLEELNIKVNNSNSVANNIQKAIFQAKVEAEKRALLKQYNL